MDMPNDIAGLEASATASRDQMMAAALEKAEVVRCHYLALRKRGFSRWMAAWMTKSFHDIRVEAECDPDYSLDFDDEDGTSA